MTMNAIARRTLGSNGFFKVTLTAAMGWIIVTSVDFSWSDLAPETFGFETVAFVFFVLAVQLLLAALRWDIVLRSVGITIAPLRILRFRFMSLFAGLALPASVGATITQIALARKDGASIEKAFVCSMIDRALAMATLILLGLAGLPYIFTLITEASISTSLFLFVCGSVLGIVFFLLSFLKFVEVSESQIGKIVRRCRTVAVQFLGNPTAAASSLIVSIVAMAFGIFAIFALLSGAGANVTLLQCFFVLPAVMLLSSLPISIGGWGVREGSMILALSLIGVDSVTALSVSIQFGLLNLALSLFGGVFWLPYLLGSKSARLGTPIPKVSVKADI